MRVAVPLALALSVALPQAMRGQAVSLLRILAVPDACEAWEAYGQLAEAAAKAVDHAIWSIDGLGDARMAMPGGSLTPMPASTDLNVVLAQIKMAQAVAGGRLIRAAHPNARREVQAAVRGAALAAEVLVAKPLLEADPRDIDRLAQRASQAALARDAGEDWREWARLGRELDETYRIESPLDERIGYGTSAGLLSQAWRDVGGLIFPPELKDPADPSYLGRVEVYHLESVTSEAADRLSEAVTAARAAAEVAFWAARYWADVGQADCRRDGRS